MEKEEESDINNSTEAQKIETYTQTQILSGLGLMLVAVFFKAAKYVYEEYIFSKYHVSPLRMVGMEGLYALIFNLNWMYLLSFFRCPSDKICDVKWFLLTLKREWGISVPRHLV